MIDLFKNMFWFIMDRALTVLSCMLECAYNPQERYDETGCYRPPLKIYFAGQRHRHRTTSFTGCTGLL